VQNIHPLMKKHTTALAIITHLGRFIPTQLLKLELQSGGKHAHDLAGRCCGSETFFEIPMRHYIHRALHTNKP
jgi:hypothetical protein